MKLNSNVTFFIWLFFLMIIAGCACNSDYQNATQDSATTATDTSYILADSSFVVTADSSTMHADTTRKNSGDIVSPIPPANSVDTSAAINHPIDTIAAQQEKGSVIVYCPAKMIIHVPCIINAEITKEELEAAKARFVSKILQQDSSVNTKTIAQNIKGDSIDIYEKMRAEIEFDTEDFKLISKEEDASKLFTNKKTLDWDWTIKPLHSTSKSIIKFKFYGTNPVNNEETNILEKTINVSVQVDARSFVEKWADFLLDDPKTTITTILIPVITFFGGFLTAKRKKAEK